MALQLKRTPGGAGDKAFELCPAGNQVAILYGVVDLGTQDHPHAMDQAKRWYREVRLIWETCDELMVDGRPFAVGESYRLSLNEKANLSKVIEGMTGKKIADGEDFDLKGLIGVPCMLNIVHSDPKKNAKGYVYANVGSVSPLPKRFNAPEQVNDDLYYDLDMGAPGPDVPQWLRDKIAKSKEHATSPPVPASAFDTPPEADGPNIPF